MLYQYYHKRIKLFRIPYKILLAYHSPSGKTINNWVFYQMLPYITGIRKEINILSMSHTVITLRKSLNLLFKRIQSRGSLLINSKPQNGIKMSNSTVFIMVTSWLPGLITNYKRLILAIRKHKNYEQELKYYLKRPQKAILKEVKYKEPLSKKVIRSKKRRVPPLPSISLSLTDNAIWLHETWRLGIPSIQICDIQSNYQKVSYPIIASQSSIPFNYLILSIFSESCNYSIMYEHLYFLSIYKYLNVTKRLNKKLKKKTIIKSSVRYYIKRYIKRNQIRPESKYIRLHFSKPIKKWYKKRYKKFKKTTKRKIRRRRKKISKIIRNKKTFIINKRFFAYQFREILKSPIKVNNFPNFSPLQKYNFLLTLRKTTFLILKDLGKFIKLMERIQKIKNRIYKILYNYKPGFYLRRRVKNGLYKIKNVWRDLNKQKGFGYRKHFLIKETKRFLFQIFTLSILLKKKKKHKAKFLTTINLSLDDIPSHIYLGLLYNPRLSHKFLKLVQKRKLFKEKKLFLLKKTLKINKRTRSKSLLKKRVIKRKIILYKKLFRENFSSRITFKFFKKSIIASLKILKTININNLDIHYYLFYYNLFKKKSLFINNKDKSLSLFIKILNYCLKKKIKIDNKKIPLFINFIIQKDIQKNKKAILQSNNEKKIGKLSNQKFYKKTYYHNNKINFIKKSTQVIKKKLPNKIVQKKFIINKTKTKKPIFKNPKFIIIKKDKKIILKTNTPTASVKKNNKVKNKKHTKKELNSSLWVKKLFDKHFIEKALTKLSEKGKNITERELEIKKILNDNKNKKNEKIKKEKKVSLPKKDKVIKEKKKKIIKEDKKLKKDKVIKEKKDKIIKEKKKGFLPKKDKVIKEDKKLKKDKIIKKVPKKNNNNNNSKNK